MAGKSYTVRKVGDELQNAVAIREALKGEDPQLILDCIEGQTDLHEAVLVVYEEVAENETMIAGLDITIKALQARKGAFERAAETLRGVILMAMDRAGIQTVKGPLATLTRREIEPRAKIDNEAEIPSRFWKPQDPVLDKKAINEAFAAGETIPGVSKSNGSISLTIRKV